jgi:hypothetical protein
MLWCLPLNVILWILSGVGANFWVSDLSSIFPGSLP